MILAAYTQLYRRQRGVWLGVKSSPFRVFLGECLSNNLKGTICVARSNTLHLIGDHTGDLATSDKWQ